MNDQTPTPSRNDPTPERRVGDAPIKPVVIAAIVTILILLVGAIILIKTRQTKVIPKVTDPHRTTQVTPYPRTPLPHKLAA